MAENLINGRPPRLPHKDPSVMGVRVGWLKLGGKEETSWGSGFGRGQIVLYWEVWTEQDKGGRQYPASGYVVEHTTVGGSKAQRFKELEDADRYFEEVERENLIDIAVSALGISLP